MCAGRERAFPLCAGITFRLHGLFFCAAPLLRPFLRQVRGLWHKTKTSACFAPVPPVLRCRRFPLFPASLSQQCACRFLGKAPCCAFRGECGQPLPCRVPFPLRLAAQPAVRISPGGKGRRFFLLPPSAFYAARRRFSCYKKSAAAAKGGPRQTIGYNDIPAQGA